MKYPNFFIAVLILSALSFEVTSNEFNRYQVTLLRASPGQLPELIAEVKKQESRSRQDILVMRHSQGDHWDLMLLMPAGAALSKPVNYQQLVDFQHDFLSTSEIDWPTLQKLSTNAGLFHVEMFHAAAGAYAGLLEQRKMENQYLEATQRKANLIFETYSGSDVDLFTLGIYTDLQAFAAEPALPDEVFEKAATDAGFKSRSDIGFYLRRFLVAHQDTLATQVK
ncbi:MAG: hypothetical protein HKN85_00010 [Gammaproteobacteria bacterium]|nr:hypothetical protein [Gammaproteobacteria bacterium]